MNKFSYCLLLCVVAVVSSPTALIDLASSPTALVDPYSECRVELGIQLDKVEMLVKERSSLQNNITVLRYQAEGLVKDISRLVKKVDNLTDVNIALAEKLKEARNMISNKEYHIKFLQSALDEAQFWLKVTKIGEGVFGAVVVARILFYLYSVFSFSALRRFGGKVWSLIRIIAYNSPFMLLFRFVRWLWTRNNIQFEEIELNDITPMRRPTRSYGRRIEAATTTGTQTESIIPTEVVRESLNPRSPLNPILAGTYPKCMFEVCVRDANNPVKIGFEGFGFWVDVQQYPGANGIFLSAGHLIFHLGEVVLRNPNDSSKFIVVPAKRWSKDHDFDLAFFEPTQSEAVKLGITKATIPTKVLGDTRMYVVAYSRKVYTQGMLTGDPHNIAHVKYEGSTMPGFSGCPYLSGKQVLGIHIGSLGEVGMGIDMKIIALKMRREYARKKAFVPEGHGSVDTGEFLENAARQAAAKGRKGRKYQVSYDQWLYEIDGKQYYVFEDEIEDYDIDRYVDYEYDENWANAKAKRFHKERYDLRDDLARAINKATVVKPESLNYVGPGEATGSSSQHHVYDHPENVTSRVESGNGVVPTLYVKRVGDDVLVAGEATAQPVPKPRSIPSDKPSTSRKMMSSDLDGHLQTPVLQSDPLLCIQEYMKRLDNTLGKMVQLMSQPIQNQPPKRLVLERLNGGKRRSRRRTKNGTSEPSVEPSTI
nr:VP1 [Bayan-Khairhan-Ula Melophagus solemo-like virus]